LDANLLREALEITPIDQAHQFVSPPSSDAIIDFVNQLGYPGEIHFVLIMAPSTIWGDITIFTKGLGLLLTLLKMTSVLEISSGKKKTAPKADKLVKPAPVKQAKPATTKQPTPKPVKEKSTMPTPLQKTSKDTETGIDTDKVISEGDTEILNIGQAGSDLGKSIESRPPPDDDKMDKDQAGSDPGKSPVALAGPNPEPMHDDFVATVYPKVHESLKFLADEQVILEDPLSSSGTLSSLKILDDTYTFGDQFFNYKSTKDEPRKQNNLRSRVFTLELRDLPHKINQTVNEVVKENTPSRVSRFHFWDLDSKTQQEQTAELHEGQAGSDLGKTIESRPPPDDDKMDKDQAGSDPGKSHVALAGPNPEPMHDDFVATVYPKVHESLKFLADEQVILEDPLSSSGTLSSLKILDDTYTFGDQFFNYKSTKDEPRKQNVDAKQL
nr:hypothetical protein [Tanacetum cinerariifolium]